MRAFNRTIYKANTDGDNNVGKHTFRLLMLNTLYFCRVYALFPFLSSPFCLSLISLSIAWWVFALCLLPFPFGWRH